MRLLISFLLLSFLCVCSVYGSKSYLGFKLDQKEWIGLGFYLAPYPEEKEPLYYEDCYLDRNYLMNVPYAEYSGKLLTGLQWKGGNFQLKTWKSSLVFCKPDKQGYFRELVFYKDLLEPKKLYLGKTVWAKKSYIYTRDARGRVTKYQLLPFSTLKIVDVSLAPATSSAAIRFHLTTERGYTGYLDLNYTAVNSPPPYQGIETFFYMDHPTKVHGISASNWDLIQAGKVRRGMSPLEVSLSLGKPFRQWKSGKEETLVYRGKFHDTHYIFYKDSLVEKLTPSDDEL